MGATLAAAGRNPVSGERVASRDVVRDVLTVMSTCGMYDGTGRFAVEVGMPAKSGVSGGILAVAPGRLGLAVYAPPLDAKGNSVRGMAVLQEAAVRRSLHLFDPTAPTAAPEPPLTVEAIRRALEDARHSTRSTAGGAVTRYIPELAAVDPNRYACAACTVLGETVVVGDGGEAFTIQAAANPFAYALALAAHGPDAVHAKVGVEPSGNPYNAIEFAPDTRRPYNPFSNAGAIAIAALQPGRNAEDRWTRLAQAFAALAGADRLLLDEAVHASERRVGARNRAIAYLLRNFGVIDDVDEALDRYLRQCALRVTARQLAAMGAVLAAGGRQPVTGERLLPAEVVQRVLTVMYTCGMHDASGQFAFEVGLAGKSGISGAIVAVVPGNMGLAVFSPPVDRRGASVRGFAALRELSRALRLGAFATSDDGV
jgi:glutaminase A